MVRGISEVQDEESEVDARGHACLRIHGYSMHACTGRWFRRLLCLLV